MPLPPPEDGYATVGPLHPAPLETPRWMNPDLPISSEATPTASMAGLGMNVDNGGHSRWMQCLAPIEPEIENVQRALAASDTQKGKSVVEDTTFTVNIQGNVMQTPSQVKFPVFSASVSAPKPALKSVIYGPSILEDPMVTVVLSLLKKVSCFFTINPSPSFL